MIVKIEPGAAAACRKMRLFLGLTIEDVARRSGASHGSVVGFEKTGKGNNEIVAQYFAIALQLDGNNLPAELSREWITVNTREMVDYLRKKLKKTEA